MGELCGNSRPLLLGGELPREERLPTGVCTGTASALRGLQYLQTLASSRLASVTPASCDTSSPPELGWERGRGNRRPTASSTPALAGKGHHAPPSETGYLAALFRSVPASTRVGPGPHQMLTFEQRGRKELFLQGQSESAPGARLGHRRRRPLLLGHPGVLRPVGPELTCAGPGYRWKAPSPEREGLARPRPCHTLGRCSPGRSE